MAIEYRKLRQGLYRVTVNESGRVTGATAFSHLGGPEWQRFSLNAFTTFVGPDAEETEPITEEQARALFVQYGGKPEDFDL